MNDYDFNFNEADDQQDEFGLIPDKTIAKIIMIIKSNEEDALTQSKTSEAKFLDCEFTVLSGKFENRKFWQNMMVSGGKKDKNDKSISGNITRSTLRAILESSRNIKPDDASKNAVAARQVSNFWDFNEMEFVGKIKIKKAKKNSGYDDKNELAVVITPDKSEYQIIMSGGEVKTEEKKPAVTKIQKAQQTQQWGGNQNPSQNPSQKEKDEIEQSSPNGNIPPWAQ